MSVKSVMFEIEGLIKNAVMSCAAMYGFSAEEALAKIDSNGNLIKAVVDKESEKAEKQRLKEAEKTLVEEKKVAEKAEKKESEKALIKQQKVAEKKQKEALVNQQKAELASMKEEEILSKVSEKQFLKQKKEAEKKPKKVKSTESAPVIIKSSEDEPFIRFQNIPLMNEINSIRNVKKFKNFKKLSAGVKLLHRLS